MPTLHGQGSQAIYVLDQDTGERGELEEARSGTFEDGRFVQGQKTIHHEYDNKATQQV